MIKHHHLASPFKEEGKIIKPVYPLFLRSHCGGFRFFFYVIRSAAAVTALGALRLTFFVFHEQAAAGGAGLRQGFGISRKSAFRVSAASVKDLSFLVKPLD